MLPRAGSTLTVPDGADSYAVTAEIGRETTDLDFAFQVPLVVAGIDLLATSDSGVSDDDLTNFNKHRRQTIAIPGDWRCPGG